MTAPTSVRSTINYIRNPPGAGAPTLEFVTEDEDRSTMVTTPGRTVSIVDARTLPVSASLDREGFELLRHRSAVEDFSAIEVDAAVDEHYGVEVVEPLRRRTGADRVLPLGGAKKRFGERAVTERAGLTNAKPARYPHADNTDESSASQVELFVSFFPDVDLARYRRHALYNVWRCVTPPPQDIPLALCDARSIDPVDEVVVTAITPIPGIGDYRHDTTSYVHSPQHRWHYFRDLTPGEVIVFKTHDSDPERPRRVAHSAFDDPTCPPGTPTRASVEARALALFT